MFDWLRRIVAGAKNRTVDQKYDLDLTYITPQLIAMAYPASGIEQIYRNTITDVAAFLQSQHADSYEVINVSDRAYDYSFFGGRVREYPWPDHQAPCLATLFEIAEYACEAIAKSKGKVIAVHCNHGKGRTGTAIMSILLFRESQFATVDEVLSFYNLKRFSHREYKVEQPCQLRYLQFFKTMMDCPSQHRKLKAYKLQSVSHEGLGDSYYVRISHVRDRQIVLPKFIIGSLDTQCADHVLMGDIFIEIMQEGLLCDTRIARINFNLSFLVRKGESFVTSFSGIQLTTKACHSKNYRLTLSFRLYCQCHDASSLACPCCNRRASQSMAWQNMHRIIQARRSKKSPEVQEIKLQLNTEHKLQ